MPLYQIKCDICGKEDEVYRSVANYNDLPECCGHIMGRTLTIPTVIADIQPYRSMATGEMITSRSQHRKHLSANGLVEVGNESMTKKESYLEQKQQKESLRREIAARIDSI